MEKLKYEDDEKKFEDENNAKEKETKTKENADTFNSFFGKKTEEAVKKLGGGENTKDNLNSVIKNYDKADGNDLTNARNKTIEATLEKNKDILGPDKKAIIDSIKSEKMIDTGSIEDALKDIEKVDDIISTVAGAAKSGTEINQQSSDVKSKNTDELKSLELKKEKLENLKPNYKEGERFSGFAKTLIESCKKMLDNKIDEIETKKGAENIEFPDSSCK